MGKLTWTSEAPTEPGAYWIRAPHETESESWEIVWVRRGVNGCYARSPDGVEVVRVQELDYCQWAGPLPEPEAT